MAAALSSPCGALTQREQRRLARILARLASPFDGERAAAALLASAFLANHGLSWSDVTGQTLSATEPALPREALHRDRRRARGATWKGYCRRHALPSSHKLSCVV